MIVVYMLHLRDASKVRVNIVYVPERRAWMADGIEAADHRTAAILIGKARGLDVVRHDLVFGDSRSSPCS